MAKRKKKRVSTQHVGKAIKLAIKQLKTARAAASPKGKKHIDLSVKVLNTAHASVIRACKGSWLVTN